MTRSQDSPRGGRGGTQRNGLSASLRLCGFALLLGCAAGASPTQAAPREESVEIPGKNVKFTLVYVPGGKDGDREIRPYWIGKHEVTWEEYTLYYEGWRDAKVDGVTRPTQPDVINPKEEPFPSDGRQPAVGIGRYGAGGYCEWLSKHTGMDFRLPTEAEWEFACRTIPSSDPVDDHAWHKGNSEGVTHDVGSRKANALGLHDMLGNVMEHCLEPFAPDAWAGAMRGGAWNTPPGELEPGKRQRELTEPWHKRDPKIPWRAWWLTDAPFVGLRVVRPVEDGATKEARAAAAAKVEVLGLARTREYAAPLQINRIRGEVRNSGTRALEEVEVVVYFLDEEGKPVLFDPREKPAFATAWPALANSFHPGAHRKPLQPGETRAFEAELPQPWAEAGVWKLKQLGATVTRVRLSR